MVEKNLEITVIMPALNEERNIALAIQNTMSAFNDFGVSGEVVVVNDGSSDKTALLVNDLMKNNPSVRMITHVESKGIGASFWDGLEAARGQAIVLLPGDNENDPWEIFRYYRLLEHVDIIIPFVFNKEVRPAWRNALSFFYRFIINSTFHVNFNYTNGTVMYRKSILKDVSFRSSGFFFQTDILIRLVKRGYLFAEVPYRLGVRKEGISKAVSFPSFLQVAKGYLNLIKGLYFDMRKNEKNTFSEDSLTSARRSQTD